MVPGEEHGLNFTLHDIMPAAEAVEAAFDVLNPVAGRAGDDLRATGSTLPAESVRDAAPAGPDDQSEAGRCTLATKLQNQKPRHIND